MPLKYNEPHVVYLAWEGPNLLYVGATRTLHKRLIEHKCASPWGTRWTAVDVISCANWQAADVLERELISLLQPPYNRFIPKTP